MSKSKRLKQQGKANQAPRTNSGFENIAADSATANRSDPRFKALKVISQVTTETRQPTLEDISRMYGAPATLGEPDAATQLANDTALATCHSLLQHAISVMGMDAYPQFLGYGYLTGLAQNGLIRAGCEMIADEMVQKGIQLTTKGSSDPDEAKQEKMDKITEYLEKIQALKKLREAIVMSNYYGGDLMYLDYKGIDPSTDDLINPLPLTPEAFANIELKGLKVVEPYNISPGQYNASNPLEDNYFKPSYWFVLGRPVHESRVIHMKQNELPSLLRPAYNFFGIPLSQIVLDAVAHFTECREAEARLLTKFSLTVFKTNLAEQLMSGADWSNIDRRMNHFIKNRNNDGAMLIDKELEDIIGIATPLSGVKDIVSQSMEIVAAYFNEPVTKMWGLTPSGFNSGDSDLLNHYDHIASQQEKMMRDPLEYLLKVIQLQEFGEIDEEITFIFNPLSEEKEQEAASVQKTKAETADILIGAGVVSPDEARESLKADPKSGFNNLLEEEANSGQEFDLQQSDLERQEEIAAPPERRLDTVIGDEGGSV